MISHINLTGQPNGPTAGLLRNGGKLEWPAAWDAEPLQSASDGLRQSIEKRLPRAIANARDGHVDKALVSNLKDDVAGLQKTLNKMVGGLRPELFVEANRYLQQLRDGVDVLARDDAAKYVGNTFRLAPEKIKAVPDLVAFMSENHLSFAPAVNGDETAYLDLHKALVQCDGDGPKKMTPVDAGEL
jgi:hypothetical protein